MATLACLLVHTNFTLRFLLETKIINSTRFPRLSPRLAYWAYGAVMVVDFVIVYKMNNQMMAKLDAKYTPIWTKITSEL